MSKVVYNTEPKIQLSYKDPLNYKGSGFFITTAENEIIDTVLVELRIDKNISSDISKKAILIANGLIVDIDGLSPLSFNIIPGNYYIVVKHRNHLSVMSSEAVSFP